MGANDILEHHGVKGMKWGTHRRSTAQTPVLVKTVPGKRVKAKGGKNHPAHEDAIRTVQLRQKAKASSPHSLSNKELQDVVTRMNLEQQYSRLSASQKNAGAKFASDILVGVGKQQMSRVANDYASQQVGARLKK